jgi:hypothetical protein
MDVFATGRFEIPDVLYDVWFHYAASPALHSFIVHIQQWRLKGQCHEIFHFWFFHESVSLKPLSIPFGPFQIVSKIRGDIRSSRFASGVVDTGGKFSTGVVDTSGAPWPANISANFRKNSKWSWWDTLGLGGNWFMEKTRSKKSRDTVPFKN